MKKIYLIGIFFSIFLLLGCPVVDPLHKVKYPVEEGDVLFYPLTNKLTPPTNFTVDVSGRNPVLTWTPNYKADYYRIYRKRTESDRFIVVDFGSCIRGESFSDLSIDKSIHSDTYEYRISSVDRFDREGFLSNPVVAVVSSPVFTATANIVDASKGFFDSITVGSKVVAQQNKIGILLKIKKPENYQVGVNDAVAFRILRKRTASGDWSVLLPHFDPDPTEAYADPKAGTTVFYHVDVPPSQGEEYSYKIVPINSFGKLGQESAAVIGYVYGIPKIKASNPMALDGNKTGAIDFEFSLPEKLEYVNLYVAKKENGPYLRIPGRNKINLSTKSLVTPILSSAVFSAVGEPSATSGSYFFLARGSYGIFSNPSGGEVYETVDSEVFSSAVYDASLSLLTNPVVEATDGTKNPVTGSIEKKISLKWQKAAGSITKYQIYRCRNLNWRGADDDRTGWGSPIAAYSVDSSTPNEIEWTDNTADMGYGAYFYKVNPVASGLEQQNDDSISVFAQAVMKLSSPVELNASERTHKDKVVLSWNELSGGGDSTLLYRIEEKKTDSDPWNLLEESASLAAIGGKISYIYPTDYVGPIRFQVTPVAHFNNGSSAIAQKEAGEAAASTGGREITDIEWTKLVMETIYDAQKTIKPSERQNGSSTSGGVYCANAAGTVEFRRRMYYSGGSSEKYDVFNFNNFPSLTGGITLAEGAVYHIICKGDSKKVIFLSYSSNVFYKQNSSSTDKRAKTQGEIGIDGFYPGKIQLWFKNQGYSHINDEYDVLPVANYPTDLFYTEDHKEWINWFNDSYGLKIKEDETPGINKDTAYAIKRDGAVEITKISFESVGAIK